MLTLLSKDGIIRVSIFIERRGDMCESTQLKALQARKKAVLNSLEYAISNGDRGLTDICERELKSILKQISKIKIKK